MGAAISTGLFSNALDIAALTARLSDPRAGGILTFAGTTRAETHPAGQTLLALDYEAYADMAARQLEDLAESAAGKWGALAVVVHHRLGRVEVGEPSVFIGVATAHRAAAFEAGRFLIDTLKASAAIWKKEVWADGAATWVHPVSGLDVQKSGEA